METGQTGGTVGGVGLIPGFLAMDHTVASSPSE